MNGNVAACPHCGHLQEVSNMNLSEVSMNNNIIDVVGKCNDCNEDMLIEAEATDGCDVFEHGILLYNVEELKEATVYYNFGMQNENTQIGQVNYN